MSEGAGAGAAAGVSTSAGSGSGGGGVVMGGAAAGGAGATMGGVATGGIGGNAVRPVDPALQPPSLRLPQNGRATGSVWVERSRRPRFAWSTQPDFTYELQVDDSCEVGALQECPFASPEWTAENLTVAEATPEQGLPVSEEAPVGRRYYWRARSCTSAACSPWSQVRYVDVGRQHSDFDGDGFADVILTDQGSIGRQGRVLVGFGPKPSQRTISLKDAVAPETADHFGQAALPLGDMDADGFADLLVVAPGDQQQLPGIAYVYFGSASFADASGRERLLLEADQGARLLGVATAAGDVDADGLQDFVLDSYPSGPALYRATGRSVSATLLPIPQPGAWMAWSSAGDVTGDGHADLLAMIAPNAAAVRTRYDLFRGSAMGLVDAAIVNENSGYPDAWWTITGDVNGDGFSDLGCAVNHISDAPSNRIDVTWGAEAPLADKAVTWAGGLTDHYGNIGRAIAAGDVNADGFDDALSGIVWHTSDVAQANLYLGGRGSRTAPDAAYAFQSGIVLFLSEGLVSAAGDVDADGFDDILLAEDYSRTAQLFFGSADLDLMPDDHLALPAP